jgi:hypothetical protein
MKSLITLIILIIIGILAYNYFFSGPLTEEEKKLDGFRRDFDSALKQMRQAERTLAISGGDTSADIDDAIARVEKIKESLASFIERGEDKKLLKKARALEERINTFLRKNY